MTTPTLLVTGAAGQLGRAVLDTLLELKAGKIIATTRKPESLAAYAAKGVEVRAADFDKPEGLPAAFKGATHALLISTDSLDGAGTRLKQHTIAIRAFQEAGLTGVVYTSLPNPGPSSPVTIAVDHRETEAALAASTLEFTVLRNNLYTELLLFAVPGAVASGQLIDARANGATAYVTRADCARAAAYALAKFVPGRRTLDVTGPEALTSDQIAALVTELTGKPIKHVSLPANALIDGMVGHGMPKPVAELYASFDLGIAKGDLATVTQNVS